MAPKSAEALRKQKEAKQKMLLLALAPVLLGLLAWQGPKTYKALTAGSAAPAPPPVTTTTTTTSTGPALTGTTPVPSGSGATSVGDLPDSDPLLPPDIGQLIVFSRFVAKDPFRAKPSVTPNPDTTDEPTGAASMVAIEVNGTPENVKVGDTFPASDPAFRLVAAGGTSAEIGLVSGSFSSGQETIALRVGETLVLVDDSDGTRYAIKLISVG